MRPIRTCLPALIALLLVSGGALAGSAPLKKGDGIAIDAAGINVKNVWHVLQD